ncbi:DUF2735 domain-containing protein [Methylobacterium sp. R2-1]|uniref:DUF2735 domain-containing protein n=1 Tax=Methylobacterium sp. R2-1 TaxID=2587064 RepID=UPI003917E535
MTAFRLSRLAGKFKPANQNQMISRSDREQPEKKAESKSTQPGVSSSAWYHEAAIREELGRNLSKKR